MQNKRIVESLVNEHYSGMRLDLYLSKRFSYHSRTLWQREIAEGKIILNGSVIVNVKRKIYPGDRLEYMAGEIHEPEIDPEYSVVFENENYLAVNKTGNLPVHPSGIFFRNTLVALLEEKHGEKFYPVHRIDRETSGAVLFAKNSRAVSAVQGGAGIMEKEYLAVVRGVFIEPDFSVDMPIGPARSSLINKKREAYGGAPEEALTRFNTVCTNGTLSLVKAQPVTGRLHQIRVHLLHAGYPILGDKIYGSDERIYLEYIKYGITPALIRRSGFSRCALHSCSLTFFDGFEKRSVRIAADMPKDICELLNREGFTGCFKEPV